VLSRSAKVESEAEPRRSQTDELIDMAAADAELFATPSDEIAYAAIRKKTHREVWPVQSRGFKRWLTHRYFLSFGRAPSAEALNRALATLDAVAAHGKRAPVFLRRAEKDGKLYLDLCDERWRALEISAEGWRITEEPPVYFTRAPGMMALCEPERGGSIEDLRALLTVAVDSDFQLIVAWLLAALRGQRAVSHPCSYRRGRNRKNLDGQALAQPHRSASGQGAPAAAKRARPVRWRLQDLGARL
jgi:hypothetical protein